MPTMHLGLAAGHLKVVDRVLLHFTIFETGQNLKPQTSCAVVKVMLQHCVLDQHSPQVQRRVWQGNEA